MTQPVTDDTFVDLPESQQSLPPNPLAAPQPAPTPRDMAQQQPNAPRNEPGDDTGDDDKSDGKGKGRKLETIEDYEAELAKVRKESASRRAKLRELEPLAQQAREAEEAQKTELQRAQERAEAAEARDRERQENFDRLNVAVAKGVYPENIEFIGSGSREEMEARADRLVAMHQPHSSAPPTDRPVEGLRPGASPEPPRPADDSYPAAWAPSYVRDGENENRRTQYGQ
jgi:hypothetical protein